MFRFTNTGCPIFSRNTLKRDCSKTNHCIYMWFTPSNDKTLTFCVSKYEACRTKTLCFMRVQKKQTSKLKNAKKWTITHYLTSILLKFLSAKIDNREPAGFEVINFCGQKFQQNTREIMLLLSQIKYQQENNL